MTGQDSHGGPWSTLMHSCVCLHTYKGVCECLQGPEKEAKCWLRPLPLLWWPAVEAALARKHAGSPCVIPTDPPGQPPATVTTLSQGQGLRSHCQTTEDFRGAGQFFVTLSPSDGPSEYINLKPIYMHNTVEQKCIHCLYVYTNCQEEHSISVTL